jgi:hypothetical protein
MADRMLLLSQSEAKPQRPSDPLFKEGNLSPYAPTAHRVNSSPIELRWKQAQGENANVDILDALQSQLSMDEADFTAEEKTNIQMV